MVTRFGSAASAFDATPASHDRSEAWEQARSALADAHRIGAFALVHGDPCFPRRACDLGSPPPVLFAQGDLGLLERKSVAIVGTRRATPYGERVARGIASGLARAGVTIVSGMARGIDGVAHRAALEEAGGTIAVLGTGLDVAYPRAHRALQRAVAERGLLLSEELPGARGGAASFPRRNRIIAALADLVIVVEAGARSGAIVTADHALDLGRDVAAVPGPIDSPASVGSNRLLRDGAIVITELADPLTLLGLDPEPDAAGALPTDPVERAVWEALGVGAASADEVAMRANLPARECLAAISALELAGVVACAPTGEVRRR